MKAGPYVWLGVLAWFSAPHVSAQAGSPALQSVQAAVEGDRTVVTVTADGPLPEPSSGTAETPPPRIFLDFTEVRPLAGVAGKVIRLPGGGAVTKIRVAQFSAHPSVTRVVLDLPRLEPFTLNVEDRASGRIRIVLGSPPAVTAAAPSAPAPAAPTPAPPAVTLPAPAPPPVMPPPVMPSPVMPPIKDRSPAEPAIPAPPDPTRRGAPPAEPPGGRPAPGAVDLYRRQLAGSIEQVASHRSVIAAIDLERNVTPATLQAALIELKSLKAKLETVTPSDELRPTHDLLLASCGLGATAVGLRLEAELGGEATASRNAASAAAGALMLLDRACAVIGCGPKR